VPGAVGKTKARPSEMSDSELRAAFRQAIERAEQSPGAHSPLCLLVAVLAAPPGMRRTAAERCRALRLCSCAASLAYVVRLLLRSRA